MKKSTRFIEVQNHSVNKVEKQYFSKLPVMPNKKSYFGYVEPSNQTL
jgi:hypothetical protein